MATLAEQAAQNRAFTEAVCQRIAFENSERLMFIAAHPRWRDKEYGANEYVQHLADGEKDEFLYVSLGKVKKGSPPPDVANVSPANWRRVV